MVQRTIEPVDVYDNELMVALGIRQPQAEPRDPEVWEKTDKEKALLRKYRRRHDNFGHRIVPPTPLDVYDKLIIQIKKHSKFKTVDKWGRNQYKTTFSTKCHQGDIARILSRYSVNGKSLVIKYHWNGKTYPAGVLPYRS